MVLVVVVVVSVFCGSLSRGSERVKCQVVHCHSQTCAVPFVYGELHYSIDWLHWNHPHHGLCIDFFPRVWFSPSLSVSICMSALGTVDSWFIFVSCGRLYVSYLVFCIRGLCLGAQLWIYMCAESKCALCWCVCVYSVLCRVLPKLQATTAGGSSLITVINLTSDRGQERQEAVGVQWCYRQEVGGGRRLILNTLHKMLEKTVL